MKLPPDSSVFMEPTCLAVYSSRKKAKTAGKEQPPPPPLLIASFSDNYLDIGGIKYVMDMDELDENRGRVFRDCQVTSKNVSDNFEAQPLIEVWRQRHFAVENLKAYLDAIASL
ncbi:unnamed protein product [Tilletia laevis]|uniref:Uncharacterized protein n=3 Tax=Tilletia TaxID=13289 RepID=A0A9N8M1Y7_9BASI|nr:hypothetical protein CF336_g5348 [Tilletia laevis]KAE8256911.1 hypothetical protein A4X03_0g4934 [Tilletia caries]CAD6952823.1 unnamed protein product [Tilletia laevis]CAD7061036.1 unnamed protein product [Tilletia caries]